MPPNPKVDFERFNNFKLKASTSSAISGLESFFTEDLSGAELLLAGYPPQIIQYLVLIQGFVSTTEYFVSVTQVQPSMTSDDDQEEPKHEMDETWDYNFDDQQHQVAFLQKTN